MLLRGWFVIAACSGLLACSKKQPPASAPPPAAPTPTPAAVDAGSSALTGSAHQPKAPGHLAGGKTYRRFFSGPKLADGRVHTVLAAFDEPAT